MLSSVLIQTWLDDVVVKHDGERRPDGVARCGDGQARVAAVFAILAVVAAVPVQDTQDFVHDRFDFWLVGE